MWTWAEWTANHATCPAISGKFLACGSYLKLRDTIGSETCPFSTMTDQYQIIRDADQVITV